MRHLTLITRVLFIAVMLGGLAGFTPFPSPAGDITVTTTLDEYEHPGPGAGCSLREAITAANSDSAFGGCSTGSGLDTILIPAGTYTLSRIGEDTTNVLGDLNIYSDLTLLGAGMTQTIIDADGIDRVFHVSGLFVVHLQGLTMLNGVAVGNTGGGLYNEDAILTLDSVRVSGNRAADSQCGGGISNSGDLRLQGCLIEDNTAGDTVLSTVRRRGGRNREPQRSAHQSIDHPK